MAKTRPKIGDAVIHHGRPQVIVGFQDRARIVDGEAVKFKIAVFENDIDRDGNPDMAFEKTYISRATGEEAVKRSGNYRAKCLVEDLVWSKSDGAWYLPGRVLCYDERFVYEALIGVRPRPDSHLVARSLLAQTDLGEVDVHAGDATRGPSALVEVIKKYKVPQEVDEDGEPTESEESWNARAAVYAKACLEHCAEVRALRQEEVLS